MSDPQFVRETSVLIQRATKVSDTEWRSSAILIWPDGSCDVGAAALDGATKEEAEMRARDKALDRYHKVLEGRLHKTHNVPGALFMFLKP